MSDNNSKKMNRLKADYILDECATGLYDAYQSMDDYADRLVVKRTLRELLVVLDRQEPMTLNEQTGYDIPSYEAGYWASKAMAIMVAKGLLQNNGSLTDLIELFEDGLRSRKDQQKQERTTPPKGD